MPKQPLLPLPGIRTMNQQQQILETQARRIESADSWAALGHLAQERAIQSTSLNFFDRAESYRLCAEQCFRFEKELRKP